MQGFTERCSQILTRSCFDLGHYPVALPGHVGKFGQQYCFADTVQTVEHDRLGCSGFFDAGERYSPALAMVLAADKRGGWADCSR